MPAEEKPNTESAVANGSGMGGDSGHGSTLGSAREPLPMFVHKIFSFIPDSQGLAGGGGSHSTLGGAPTDRDPVFVVYTYPFVPSTPPSENIDKS
jgi:hypothetical protein